MFPGPALQVLLGRKYTDSKISTFHAVVGFCSTLITTIFRVALLIISLKLGGNSTYVRLRGDQGDNIGASDKCDYITVVWSSGEFSTYYKSEYEVDKLLDITDEMGWSGDYNGEGGLYYEKINASVPEYINQNYLVGHKYNWYRFHTISDTKGLALQSNDDHGYFSYFYYCGDESKYLNNTWVPLLAWLIVNILPPFFLSIINLLPSLRSGCFLISCTNPALLLSGIFSHFQVGPVSYKSMKSGHLCLSKILSILNIFLTFVGMVVHLYLITAQFGAGDSSSLQVIMPIIICAPMFILSACFAICFLHCFCCRVHTEILIFNKADPGNLFIMDDKHNVVPRDGQVEMDEMTRGERL